MRSEPEIGVDVRAETSNHSLEGRTRKKQISLALVSLDLTESDSPRFKPDLSLLGLRLRSSAFDRLLRSLLGGFLGFGRVSLGLGWEFGGSQLLLGHWKGLFN